MALLRERICLHWYNKASQLQQTQQLENFLNLLLSNSEQQYIFSAVESSFRSIFHKEKVIHIHKFYVLNNEENKVLSTSASDSKKFILHLMKHAFTGSEEAILIEGLSSTE
jgi:hypothetical protein